MELAEANARLAASGEAVGLPVGQMGNSEVGHLTIGAGRRLYQDLMRVNRAIEGLSGFDTGLMAPLTFCVIVPLVTSETVIVRAPKLVNVVPA